MSILEKIQQTAEQLPPEKQHEVLDFVVSLKESLQENPINPSSLAQHPAFGSWKNRKLDSLTFQQNLRAEWD